MAGELPPPVKRVTGWRMRRVSRMLRPTFGDTRVLTMAGRRELETTDRALLTRCAALIVLRTVTLALDLIVDVCTCFFVVCWV